MKEKMIMKLEKERLIAKVENMEKSLIQIEDDAEQMKDRTDMKSKLIDTQEREKKKIKLQSGKACVISKSDPRNSALDEEREIGNAQLNLFKTFKGHLMGVTGMSYNSEKKILATCSDDSTWKLWSVPNGDLIMSGEGHEDWASGVSFHPDHQFLATSSGDGTVKVWDIL